MCIEQTLSEVGLVAGHALEGPGPDALVLPGVVDQVALRHETDLADVAFERLLTVMLDSNVFVNTKKIQIKCYNFRDKIHTYFF